MAPFGIAPNVSDPTKIGYGSFQAPGSVAGTSPRVSAPMPRFANAVGEPPPGPSMISSAPSSPSPFPSFPLSSSTPAYPTAPGMPTPQYLQTHSANWVGSMTRQRNQQNVAMGTFANERNQNIDATTAGRDAYAASHGIAPGMPSMSPTQTSFADPKQIENYHTGLMHQANDEYNMAAKSYDAAGKQTAMQKYNDARDALNSFRQQRMGGGVGASPTPAPSPFTPVGAAPGSASPTPSFLSGGSGPQQAPLAPGFPSTPSIGSAPGVPDHQALPPGAPGYAPTSEGSKGQIGITDATARQMWKQIVAQNGVDPAHLAQLGTPGGPDLQTDPTFNRLRTQFAQKLGQYGVSSTIADATLGQWKDDNMLHQFDVTETTPAKTNPAPRIPLSMIGPETGRPGTMFQPDKNGLPIGSYGKASALGYGQSESVPGPTVSPAATVTPAKTTTRPMPGNKVIRRPDAAPQQQAGGTGAAPQGTPLQLQNGRTAYLQNDGSYVDERGRAIR